MNKSISRWMCSNEQVHYLEEDVPGLVNKPLDKQGATIWHDDELVAKGGLRALQSTAHLPKDPKPGDNYQIGDNHWIWVDDRWMTRTGTYGH